MTLDQLYEIASSLGIEIDDVPMRELRAVSFPEGWIAIDRRKFSSDTEYKCKLAHEIGHCMTNSFYNIHSRVSVRELNEHRANRYAAELLVPFAELRKVFSHGIPIARILAKMFDVTLDFINMVLEIFERELLTAARMRQTAHVAASIAKNKMLSFIRSQASARTG